MPETVRNDSTVENAIRQFAATIAKKDLNAFAASFFDDEDVILYGTGADEKREGLAQIKQQVQRDWSQSEEIDLKIEWISASSLGDAAWAAIDGAFKGRVEGEDFNMPIRATFGLVRADDKWLIRQAHFSAPASGQEEGESFPTT